MRNELNDCKNERVIKHKRLSECYTKTSMNSSIAATSHFLGGGGLINFVCSKTQLLLYSKKGD